MSTPKEAEEKEIQQQQERHAEGLCIHCGKNPQADLHSRACQSCIDADNKSTQVARPGKFTFPDGENPGEFFTFNGWVIDGNLSEDGFPAPYFEKAEGLKMEDMLVTYDETIDAFIDYSCSDGEEYKAEQVQTTEGLKTLYQIGRGDFGGRTSWEEDVR